MKSGEMQVRYVIRAATEPASGGPPWVWIDTSGDNTETNLYNDSTDAWECLIANGPDTPEYPVEGSLWRDSNANKVKQYDGTAWVAISNSPGVIDRVETFAESDITLSHTRTTISGGSGVLGSDLGSSISNAGSGESDTADSCGWNINPNNDLNGIQLDSLTGGTQGISNFDYVRLYNAKDGPQGSGSVIEGISNPSSLPLELNTSLSAGSDYSVSLEDSSGFTHEPNDGYYTNISDTSTDFDWTGGWRGGFTDPSGVKSLTAIVDASSGTLYVTPDYPNDLYDWDVAKFQKTLDGETVDIYIEENQSGSWTEVAGPIQRGDPIPGDASNNIRFRVELSRADTANNPTCDALYRRYII